MGNILIRVGENLVIEDFGLMRIRKAAEERKISYSTHAQERMGERMIKQSKVVEILKKGKLIETQDSGRDVKFLLQEDVIDKEKVYIVTALPPGDWIVVVTVCRSQEEAWVDINGILKRK